MDKLRQNIANMVAFWATFCFCLGAFSPVLAQTPQGRAYFNGTSNVTINTVLELKNSISAVLNFRTCEEGEIFSQVGGTGDTFSVSVTSSGFLEASWTVGGISKSVDIGPSYATNTGWVLLRLEYTLGSIMMSADGNSTVLASESVNSELLNIDLSGGSGVVVLGRDFAGCMEQVYGLLLDMASAWYNVEWGVCPLESQQGCQPAVPNPCYTHPCKNHGVCSSNTQAQGGYTCQCTARYDGVHCENDRGPLCTNNPDYVLDCQNGGQCQEDDIGNSTFCQCMPQFEGPLCELNRTFTCDAETCVNNGTCTATSTGVECICAAGFSGDTCAININECVVNQCLNGGVCIDGIDMYTCNCTGTGYTGDFCSETINECDAQPCMNGGTCIDVSGSFVCLCVAGWTGTTCQLDLDECQSDPCMNGATCQNNFNAYMCVCPLGFTGDKCQANIDDCVSVTCPDTFICVDGIDSYTCECPAGKVNVSGSCVDYDECSSSPCVSGTCLNQDNMYECDCYPGFNGTNCDIDIDECASNPCLMNSTCNDEIDGFNCTCQPGYQGDLCNVDIDECLMEACENGATCVDGINSFACICVPGYEGELCQNNTDDCAYNPCQNGATCIDEVNDYTCTCPPGYNDKNCSTDIDECESSPCQNNGTCVDEVDAYNCICSIDYVGDQCESYYDACVVLSPCENGATCTTPALPSQEYTCECPGGFNGTNCKINIDDCIGVDCNFTTTGQICFDEIEGYRCACPVGYEDPICSVEIDECASNPCMNNATCLDNLGNFTCNCSPGFAGVMCEENIDECNPNPCQNDGICVDMINGFQCYCLPGYTGDFCEIGVQECLSDPCMNGGTCIDDVNRYDCMCAPGYTGDQCEIDIDECEFNLCQNNATCVDGIAEFTCDCTPGFNGTLCEIDIDECAVNPCGAGSCIDGINSYTCNCTDTGFNGSQCEINIDDCSPQPCQNDATCIDLIKDYNCTCWDGYQGKDCGTDINECLDVPCMNGGTCLQRSDQSLYDGTNPLLPGEFSYANASGFVCECAPGFHGVTCEVNIDECASDPCLNNATCMDGVNGYNCSCAGGWEGIYCGIEIDECLPEPCQNGATCTDLINDYKCTCTSEYGGFNCSVLLTGCNGSPCQNGGTCVPSYDEQTDTHSYTCLCDAGFTGDQCTTDTSVSFGDDSYLLDPSTIGATMLDYSISLQTTLPDGILLYSGGGTIYFLLEMFNGDLYLKYSPDGTDNNALEISDFGQLINDGEYHTVTVIVSSDAIILSVTVPTSSRSRRTATCTGGVCQQEVAIPNGMTVLFDTMFIGGVFDGLIPTILPRSRSGSFFTGCMQDIKNGDTYILPSGAVTRAAVTQPGCTRVVQCPNGNERCSDQGTCTDLWLSYSCDCYIGYAGTNCSYSFAPATFRYEDIPESYAEFNVTDALSGSNSNIQLAFRTRESEGLIFYTIDASSNSHMTLEVVNASLMVSASRDGNPASLINVGSDLSDGKYHFVSVQADASQLKVTLEPGSGSELSESQALASGTPDFTVFSVGGVVDFAAVTPNDAIISDTYFKGCLWDVKFNNYSLQFDPLNIPDFFIPSFPLMTNSSVLINGCESDDTCADSPCENGGTCIVTWNDFMCECPTGFGGKNCSELTICSKNPCPSGAECRDRPDGHDCVVEATFDGVTSLVTYAANISTTTILDVITFRARTRTPDGIIYHSSNSMTHQYVTIYLDEGMVVTRFNLGESGQVNSPVVINNGSWHDVQVRFTATTVEVTVDGVVEPYTGSSLESLAPIITAPGSSQISVAGSTIANNEYFINYNQFNGCLDDVRVGGFLLPFYDRETINSTSEEQFEASTTDVVYGCQGDPTICNSFPCENSGTCIDVWNARECVCVAGYDGDSCETDINECIFSTCAFESTCLDEINNYTCLCQPGYEGRNCDSEINECDPDPCLKGSTCYDGPNFFNCTCLEGYTGALCDVLINETCAGNPCKNGATCQDNPAGSEVLFTCDCLPGYDGQDCGHEIDYCLSNDCVNGATCESLRDQQTYICNCPDGYNGNRCQVDIDECTGISCLNGANCVDEVNGFRCNCTAGYDGLYCGNDINECDPNPCQFGATCEDLINDFNCVCLPGFSGRYCSFDINECLSNIDPPCMNGGTCMNTLGSFTCTCPSDTYGHLCQIAPCNPTPCQNNAICTTQSPGVYDCVCPMGYLGTNCSLASCADVACQNNGSCRLGDGFWECICPELVTGSLCQYKGPCTPDIDPCINGGSCQQSFQDGGSFNYTCQCPIGFNGTNCELEINWCDSNPCQNEGSNCTSSQETFHCSCGPGYNGTFCDIKLPDCNSSFCLNGATCQDLDYGYLCLCADGFSGNDCQIDINECEGQPCQHGSICTDAVNAFVCNCNGTGYEGSTCSDDINECNISTPCANNGTCMNTPGAFECRCKDGWLTPDCTLYDPCWDNPCVNGGECAYAVLRDGQTVEYFCRCNEDYAGDNCERFVGSVTNWALIGGVTGGAIVLLIVVIVLGIFLVSVKNKRATRGTYSPSRQEINGSRVEMDNILKMPPEERLI